MPVRDLALPPTLTTDHRALQSSHLVTPSRRHDVIPGRSELRSNRRAGRHKVMTRYRSYHGKLARVSLLTAAILRQRPMFRLVRRQRFFAQGVFW
jgi:hypothetical protein